MPRSPRIVPGSASFGIVLPTIFRTTAMASGPSSATAAPGPEVEDHRGARRPQGVMAFGQLAADGKEPQADDLEALALEAADDLADEPALDGIGLRKDERALHHEPGSCGWSAGPIGGPVVGPVRLDAASRGAEQVAVE